ncbi:hypothetical protein P153DRAFT_278675 [Dothidotthia symphoricarpi CBS 119687]|uniref:Integral membrane protein-like protein n=1 Tax=Dothidotthia symphoricarpi CBS 119687 TaxID=1392245 RepID=A0A6A6AWQ9_9PLEO|nr:uncharacterized protein P153DRAFT_278675 [Dothidotthia symphoricarpi CBS 119687]KAF2134961.1 hypothetical protein P153DRAFT_278675 [Dothidotthia symphoricarpi CBS 119687]
MYFSARTVTGLAVFITFAFFYTVTTLSARDPTSVFFSPRKGYAPRYSAIRRQQAQAFIQSYSSAASSSVVKAADDKRKLCVGIPSYRRDNSRHLPSAMGSLLEGLTPEERREIYLMVFITHSNPNHHPAYNEEWLAGLADEVLTYKFGDDQMQGIRNMEAKGGAFIEKGLFDYEYLLKKCAEQYTPYIAIIDDDTVAMDGWYHRTIAAIDEAERQAAIVHSKPDFLYLRLFYTEEFWGWNAEYWHTYLYYSMFVAAIPTALLFVIRFTMPTTKYSLALTTRRSMIAIYAMTGTSILLFFALGRTTVLPLPIGVHEMPAFGCCSQAFVFPTQKVVDLISYFRERRIGNTEVLIEDYANERNELRYAITPSVIQHVGRSNRETDFKPRSEKEKIWSFGFERYDWTVLKKEHEEVAREKNMDLKHKATAS